MTDKTTMMRAETRVNSGFDAARQWFLGLEDHPERYTFASHLGFYFIEGDFGKVGALFYTRERFHGLLFKLTFRLSAVTENSFTFELIKPLSQISGTYTITDLGDNQVNLTLAVYAHSRIVRWVLSLGPVHSGVKKQITSEVEHVKQSMENLCDDLR